MVIRCPNCQSKFALDAKKANPLAKARCSVCGTVFVLADGMSDEEFREASARVVSDKSSQSRPKEEIKADLPVGGEEEQFEESEADMEETVSSILKDAGSGFDLDSGIRSRPKKQGRGSKIFATIAVIIIICAVGLYVGSKMTGKDSSFNRVLSSVAGRGEAPDNEAGSAASGKTDTGERAEENIKDLVIHSVRQFYVKNEKIGQLFVIDGKVLNSFKAPKGLIKVEATLFDGEGKPLMEKEQFCGSTVTHFQLQVLSQQDLEAALNNKVEILTNNTNILPGSEVPFMVVFMNPPDTVREFGVRVVEAKDPDQSGN